MHRYQISMSDLEETLPSQVPSLGRVSHLEFFLSLSHVTNALQWIRGWKPKLHTFLLSFLQKGGSGWRAGLCTPLCGRNTARNPSGAAVLCLTLLLWGECTRVRSLKMCSFPRKASDTPREPNSFSHTSPFLLFLFCPTPSFAPTLSTGVAFLWVGKSVTLLDGLDRKGLPFWFNCGFLRLNLLSKKKKWLLFVSWNVHSLSGIIYSEKNTSFWELNTKRAHRLSRKQPCASSTRSEQGWEREGQASGQAPPEPPGEGHQHCSPTASWWWWLLLCPAAQGPTVRSWSQPAQPLPSEPTAAN